MASPSGVVLVLAMWCFAAVVLHPARLARRVSDRARHGCDGHAADSEGLGPRFALRYDAPVLLGRPTSHDDLVAEFDRAAGSYERYVRPFSGPVFDQALATMKRYLVPNARVLDVGCGPGTELRRVAALVPRGEVVGIDLAAGMVEVAHRAARARGLRNCALVQADVGALPPDFTEAFDVAYGCFSHHHYPDPRLAAAEVRRCLRPGGTYFVIDVGHQWLRTLASPLARWGDPGWIGFSTPDELRQLFGEAGFASTAQVGLLPGIDLVIARRA